MDVNTIESNMNSIKAYSSNSTDTSQYFNTTIKNNSESSRIKQIEKSQENQDSLNKKELDKAVKKLNKFLEDEKTHAEYSVHEDLGTMMIKIVGDDDKIILELPPEKILDMVASMCKQVGLLDQKA